MRSRLITTLLFLLASFSTLYSQDKGWRTELEFNVGKGFRAQIPTIVCGIGVFEGYYFNGGFYLGGGVGFDYANGLSREIHQYTTGGSIAPLSDNTTTDISWAAKALIRAKYIVEYLPREPFVVCDSGYSFRLGDKASARMNTGFFFSPGIGCRIDLFGKKGYGIISVDVSQWSFESLQTPHHETDVLNQNTVWASSMKIHFGLDF